MILELLRNNKDCELPCFWGITPGITSWQFAEQFLSSFAERIDQGPTSTSIKNGTEYSSAVFAVHNTIPEYSDDVLSSYFVTNGMVDQIIVAPRGTERLYMLHQLLNQYGLPSDVLLFLSDVSPAGKPWFIFYIFYVERGITAIYEDEAHFDGDIFEACAEEIGPTLILIPPGSKALDGMKKEAFNMPRIPSINDFPGKSVEFFYETMKSPNACLRFDPKVTE